MPVSLALISTLKVHTNFTGNAESDFSADAKSGLSGEQVIDGTTLYLFSPYGASFSLQGQVRMFDMVTGAYLGILGTFPAIGQGNMRPNGGMYIVNHPTYGKWLMMSCGPVWGGAFQLMAITGKDSGGNPVAPGTLTNFLIPLNNGIHAGSNQGATDVDSSGNIWLFGQSYDTGLSADGPPTMWQFTFTGTNTIAQVAATDFSALLGWTAGFGVRFDPLSGNLIIWGNDSGSTPIVARVDQNSSFAILASSTTVPMSIPMNMGTAGNYVTAYNFTFLAKIRCSDFTVLQTENLSTVYGLPHTINRIWYDSTNDYVWVNFQGFFSIAIVDLGNPSSAGAANLVDPGIVPEYGIDTTTICGLGGMCVTADGAHGVTVMNGGAPQLAFIDFWGGSVAAPMVLIGHSLNVLSSHYQT